MMMSIECKNDACDDETNCSGCPTVHHTVIKNCFKCFNQLIENGKVA